jgi:hypothetical protein
MNEPLLIPQHAQSLHINIQDPFASLRKTCQAIGAAFKSMFERIANVIAKAFQPLADMAKRWHQYFHRQSRKHRPSMQTRAFLRSVNGSKRHNEVHAKRRRRSVRRVLAQ